MASELARAQPLSAPRMCCLDLDTFFVSVERLLDPTLEGKPVVVGGKPGSRGVVTAASYEVRRLGVKAGMSLIEASKRAPNAIYLPTRHEIYGTYAERVREIARRFAPKVLVASIDEMYLDFSGCERLYGSGDAASGNGGEDRAGDIATERAVLQLTRAIFLDSLAGWVAGEANPATASPAKTMLGGRGNPVRPSSSTGIAERPPCVGGAFGQEGPRRHRDRHELGMLVARILADPVRMARRLPDLVRAQPRAGVRHRIRVVLEHDAQRVPRRPPGVRRRVHAGRTGRLPITHEVVERTRSSAEGRVVAVL